MHKFSFIVQETYLDVFGHMNNAMYLQLFEEARWDLIHSNGLDLYTIMSSGVGPVVLGVDLKFRKELKARQSAYITTQLMDYQGKVGHIKQDMFLAEGTLAAESVFTFGIFDTHTRKLVLPPQQWLKVLQN